MMTRILRLLLAFAPLSLGGCTLLVQDKVDDLAQDTVPDMELQLVGFDPHLGQLTEFFLVNDESLVQAHAIYDPLPGVEQLIKLDNVVAPDVRRVDFYSDLNQNRMIDPSQIDPEDSMRRLFPDHMWRITLEEDGSSEFMHNTNFTDILMDDPAQLVGNAFQLNLTGTEAIFDQTLEVKVIGPGEREVGFYSLLAVSGDTVSIEISGVIDEGTEYTITIEPQNAEEPFCVVERGGADGLTLNLAFADLTTCQD